MKEYFRTHQPLPDSFQHYGIDNRYHSSRNGKYQCNNPQIRQITAIPIGGNCVGVKVVAENKREDYVFSATDSQKQTDALWHY